MAIEKFDVVRPLKNGMDLKGAKLAPNTNAIVVDICPQYAMCTIAAERDRWEQGGWEVYDSPYFEPIVEEVFGEDYLYWHAPIHLFKKADMCNE